MECPNSFTCGICDKEFELDSDQLQELCDNMSITDVTKAAEGTHPSMQIICDGCFDFMSSCEASLFS